MVRSDQPQYLKSDASASFFCGRVRPDPYPTHFLRALYEAPSAIDDDHGSGAETFAHEIKVCFRQIFRLTDATDG